MTDAIILQCKAIFENPDMKDKKRSIIELFVFVQFFSQLGAHSFKIHESENFRTKQNFNWNLLCFAVQPREM